MFIDDVRRDFFDRLIGSVRMRTGTNMYLDHKTRETQMNQSDRLTVAVLVWAAPHASDVSVVTL